MTEGTDFSLNISSTVLTPAPGSSSFNSTFLGSLRLAFLAHHSLWDGGRCTENPDAQIQVPVPPLTTSGFELESKFSMRY